MPINPDCVVGTIDEETARAVAEKGVDPNSAEATRLGRKVIEDVDAVMGVIDQIREEFPELNNAEVREKALSAINSNRMNNARIFQLREIKKYQMLELGETYGRYMEPEVDARLKEIDASIANIRAADVPDETLLANQVELRRRELFKLQKHFPDALIALLQGETQAVKGTGISVNSVGKALAGKFLSGFEARLRKADLYDIAMGGDINRLVAKELEDLNGPRAGDATTSQEAKEIAQIIQETQKAIMDRANKAGAYMKPLWKYVAKTTHDVYKLRAKTAQEWADFVYDSDLLDVWRTFKGQDFSEGPGLGVSPALVKVELRKMYAELVSGQHMMVGDKVKPLAVKMSEHRELHFRDSDAWMTYNETFGTKDFMATVMGDFEKSGKDIGAMELLGPDISGLKDSTTQYLNEMAKINPELAKEWTGMKKNRVKALFDYVDGTSTIPVDNTLANVSRGIKATNNLRMLGSALLAQTGDPTFVAASLQHLSGSYWTGYGVALESFFKGFVMPQGSKGAQLRREIADDVGVLVEGILHDSAERFTEVNNLPGWGSKIQAQFFKAIGMNRWDNAMRTGVAYYLTHKLAKLSKKSFGGLREGLQLELRKHNIGTKEWEVIRQAKQEAADGKFYVSPREIGEMSDDAIRAVYGDVDTVAIRQDIETNYRAYLFNTISDAVPTPGIREQTRIKGTTRTGTWGGEAVSLFAQFKTFPLTAIRLLRKELHGKGIRTVGTNASRMDRLSSYYKRASVWGMFNMAAGSTLLGYLAMSLKDISKGRTPKDPREHPYKVGMAAFIQGGGAGLFGDFMFGMESRYGQGPLEATLGPSWGTLSQAVKLTRSALETGVGEGDPDKLYRQTVGFAKQWVPGILPIGAGRYIPLNMWYSRWALDYLYINYLQENTNPGYFNRMNRRLEREYGQSSWLGPN